MLSFALICHIQTKGQYSRTSDFSPEKLESKYYKLKVKGTAPANLHLPFGGIKIIDSRFDSSKVGFIMSKDFFRNEMTIFKKLKIRNGLAKSLEDYYNTYYENAFKPNNLKLLIIIKKFWITSTNPYHHQAQGNSRNLFAGTSLHAKWELYIFKDDEALAFKRIDTVIKSELQVADYLFDKDDSEASSSTRINGLLNFFIEQFNYDKPVSVFREREKKSYAKIRQINESRFLLPVLADSNINNGVFMNFTEFKNNEPSVKKFKENTMNYRTFKKEEYLTNDKDSLINNYWAYTINKQTRISQYGNDKLFRQGNTFEFFVKVRVSVFAPPGAIKFKNYITYWVPYQLDMESEEIY